MKLTINGPQDLLARAGQKLAAGEWQTMELARIQKFADATDDHQWIHVDEERAKRESPFGKAVAHGYLTLSLTAGAFFDLLDFQGFAMAVNYGSNKVRYPSPLGVGDRYRVTIALGEVRELEGGFLEAIFQNAVEIEGKNKPACVAEVVVRLKVA
ncbi:MAG: MaoC family dehydratase [Kofleriaceae bacterium]